MPKPSLRNAYRWWLLGGFGLLGLHRFYMGKPRTARIWLCTLGFFGIGAVLDLVLMRWLVNRCRMIQGLRALRAELEKTIEWKEELARNQKYEEAAYNRDKEKLLRKEIEKLQALLVIGNCRNTREDTV